jgi:hypothetical protein
VLVIHIHTRICECLREAEFSENSVELEIPHTGGLLKPIDRFLKATHLSLLSSNYKTLWLLHVYLLLELAIEERRLHIHLMDVPVLQRSQC